MAQSGLSVSPITLGLTAFSWQRLLLVALLLAETLYLSVTFDTQSLERTASFWTTIAGWSPQYLRVAIASAFVLLLLLVTRLVALRSSLNNEPISRGYVAFHIAAFLAFVWVTGRFLGGAADVIGHPGLWTATWLLTGVAMLSSWALAMYPQARWRATVIENRVLIAGSLAAGAAVWSLRFVTEAFWTPLARYTFAVVTWLLELVYPETVSRPDRLVVGTPQFRVLIAPECSGYEGIGLILGFLSIYLLLFRKELRFPSALLLLPIGALTIWIINAFRIVALIAIGDAGYRTIATGGFHSQAGWLAFNVVALGFVVLINRAGYFSTRGIDAPSAPPVAAAATDSTNALLGPFVALLATGFVTGTFTAGFDWFYGVRIAVVLTVLWAYRDTYRTLDWRCSWQAAAIGAATFGMWILLFPASLRDASVWPQALSASDPAAAAAWLAVRTLGYVLVIPVVEELAFRVYAARRLTRAEIDEVPVGSFSLWSFAVSSLLFGALHPGLWMQGTLAGMAFAAALSRRRRFGDAVLAHATTNGLLALYVFVTGQWSLWS